MAALSFASATITTPDGTVLAERANLTVRAGQARYRVPRTDQTATLDDVTDTTRIDRTHWRVTNAAGLVWIVERRGCSCGSR